MVGYRLLKLIEGIPKYYQTDATWGDRKTAAFFTRPCLGKSDLAEKLEAIEETPFIWENNGIFPGGIVSIYSDIPLGKVKTNDKIKTDIFKVGDKIIIITGLILSYKVFDEHGEIDSEDTKKSLRLGNGKETET